MPSEEVWGVTMIWNEDDIIGYTISHLFCQGLDGIIVIDHGSTDGTNKILRKAQLKYQKKSLYVMPHQNLPFYQGKMLTDMARRAHAMGAKWIVPFDADELFYCADSGISLADAIRSFQGDVIGVPMFNHYETSQDKDSENPFKRIVWRHPDQNPLDKVIYRWHPDFVIDEGHHRILTKGQAVPGTGYGIAIRHFSARNVDRFVKKSVRAGRALNAATRLDPEIGRHVRGYTQTVDEHGEEALKEHYKAWFYHENPEETMVYDPAPYQGDW